ncbi:unnamed protein product [Ceratitis capitata]|uniref:(Mediterranean fruit fly) hypothetical protein n=1 Tax=Ceratitis capitata TaxID=7213 RepID=A0A811UBX7_CERCA|nr:unnamed protein product [Ceratitis capitata]
MYIHIYLQNVHSSRSDPPTTSVNVAEYFQKSTRYLSVFVLLRILDSLCLQQQQQQQQQIVLVPASRVKHMYNVATEPESSVKGDMMVADRFFLAITSNIEGLPKREQTTQTGYAKFTSTHSPSL